MDVPLKSCVRIDYTNALGVRDQRDMIPIKITFHNMAWVLEAHDIDAKHDVLVPMASLHSWTPAARKAVASNLTTC